MTPPEGAASDQQALQGERSRGRRGGGQGRKIWADILKRQCTVEKGEVTCEQYSRWRLEEVGSSSPHTKMTVKAVGLAGENWLLGCRKAGTIRNT